MGSTLVALASIVAAFVLSALFTRWLLSSPPWLAHMVDFPNERSLHQRAVPRTGGVAIAAALAAAGSLSAAVVSLPATSAWIGAAVLLVGGVSFLDDRGEVKSAYRLFSQFVAGLLVLAGGVSWSSLELPGLHWEMPSVLARLLTLGYLVWMVNLYNFMDGMDGFAGGMTLFGFSALALLGWKDGDVGFALANALLAASAAGFLTGNFPPARIFLGDLGSATLGLLAAIFSLIGNQRGLFPLWMAWLAFSPFIVDATWTLLRRLVRGERVWQAHRSHHYQRLVLAGWSHRKTVLWSYLLMVACAATAVAAKEMSVRDQWLLLMGWAVIYLLIDFKTRLVEGRADTLLP